MNGRFWTLVEFARWYGPRFWRRLLGRSALPFDGDDIVFTAASGNSSVPPVVIYKSATGDISVEAKP